MQWLKWGVLLLAFIQGGWLVFDGLRALISGDYVTPTTGPRAGQLGPWSRIVSAAGLEPRGTLVKSIHVLLGAAWLVALVAFAARPSTGKWAILACSICSLWYLPVGTVLSIAQLVLLYFLRAQP